MALALRYWVVLQLGHIAQMTEKLKFENFSKLFPSRLLNKNEMNLSGKQNFSISMLEAFLNSRVTLNNIVLFLED
jgi:hypothetical protein